MSALLLLFVLPIPCFALGEPQHVRTTPSADGAQ